MVTNGAVTGVLLQNVCFSLRLLKLFYSSFFFKCIGLRLKSYSLPAVTVCIKFMVRQYKEMLK